MNQQPADRLVRQSEVITRTGLSRSTIWRRERDGQFPPRIHLGPRVTAWRESDLQEWMADPAGYRREVQQ